VSAGQTIRYSGGMSSVGDSINFAGATPRTYPYEVSYVASAVANSKCTVTRDGPYTLTRCGNGKVEVGYVMKGFDITNLSPVAKVALDTVRNGIQRDMARKLGLREDQLVVTIKAGSIIVSIEVADDDMPASPALGNGQDTLEMVKATPGVAQLVEAGKSLDDCFVDPEPEIQGDAASATADPHIISVSGAKFDLFKPGRTELLTIPEGASAEDALLRVIASTEQIGSRKNDLWIRRVRVSGSWVGGEKYAFKTGSGYFGDANNYLASIGDGEWTTPGDLEVASNGRLSTILHSLEVPKTSFQSSPVEDVELSAGPVHVQIKYVTSNKDNQNFNHLDVQVKGLSAIDQPLGGVLALEGSHVNLLQHKEDAVRIFR